MRQSEAKEQMRSIWLSQQDRCDTGILYPLSFYAFIQNNHPHLLAFSYSGDKYQIVKAWVHEWQEIFCKDNTR